MSTSGTVTFRQNRNEVILGALRNVGAYDPENGGPTATQISTAGEALNLLVKTMSKRGLQLWIRKYGVVFPQKNQSVFALGSPAPGGDHACLTTPLGAGGFVQTTTTAAAIAGATSISVATLSSNSTAGIPAVSISNTYNIGIVLDTGFIQWTTVNGSPSGLVVPLANALTSGVSSGNTVFCYQTKLMRPLRILDAFTRQTGGNDTPVRIIPRENYNRFGQKSSSHGIPTQLSYDPQINTGYLYLYPGFSSATKVLYIEFEKPLEDITASTDDYEMPQEWGEFLKYRLALGLGPEYEIPDVKFNQIAKLAASTWEIVDTADQENASVYMQPDSRIG